MRDYGKVSPRFWNGTTGKLLRSAGRDAQAIGLYLQTCASANMIGLYYLPLPTLCHEVGISEKAARAALQATAKAGFAFYDEESELVWVPEMARYQIADVLNERDKRRGGILKMVEPFLKHRFGWAFLDRYAVPFNLPVNETVRPLLSPFQAPSMGSQLDEKPLPSQEQEQEQEQKQENGSRPAPPDDPSTALVVPASDWNREAADDFKAAYGVYPKKEFFAQVKPVAKTHGWAKTRPVLREYMAETPLQFLNVAKCLESMVVNAGSARASPVRPAVRVSQREGAMVAMVKGGLKT